MNIGRTFFITLVSGSLALTLLFVGIGLPGQLGFESRPFARAVLLSGKLNDWTATELGITEGQYEVVKAHYHEFLRRNKADEEESSDSLDTEDVEEAPVMKYGEKEDDDRRKRDDDEAEVDDVEDIDVPPDDTVKEIQPDSSDSSESSSDLEGGEDSDNSEEEAAARLSSKAFRQTVELGLFGGRVCKQMIGSDMERCSIVSTAEGLLLLNHEASFFENEVNMPMWNNLRVEALFSIVACILGLVFLFASLKPCCDNKRLPVYLGSLAFCASGILVFIPIVRLLLVRSDLEQNLLYDYNVTTTVMTSWSLLFLGLGAPFALLASFTLIATKWYKKTKKLYTMLKTKIDEERNIHMTTVNGRARAGDDVGQDGASHESEERKEFIDKE